MTYIHKSNFSKHQRYYSNPLNPILPIWELWLLHYSFRFTKRISTRGRYRPYQMKIKNLRSCRYKKNPVVWIMESKNERKVWGKFNR